MVLEICPVVVQTTVSHHPSPRTHLPIKIESVMPHDIAGTDAPLYTARGPSLVTVLTRQSHAPLYVPGGVHCSRVWSQRPVGSARRRGRRMEGGIRVERTLIVSNGCPVCQPYTFLVLELTNYQLQRACQHRVESVNELIIPSSTCRQLSSFSLSIPHAGLPR